MPRRRSALCFLPYFWVLTLAALLIGGCTSKLSPEAQLRAALEHEAAGQLREAYLNAKSLVQEAPEMAEARWMLGRIEAKAGLGLDAEKELLKALRLGAQPKDGAEWLARALLLNGKFEKVATEEYLDDLRRHYEPPQATAEEDALRLALQGHAFYNLKEPDKARQAYQASLALNVSSAESLYGLGTLAADAGETNEGRKLLEQAIKSEPTLANAWSRLGKLELDNEKFDAATAAFEKASQLRFENTADLFLKFYALLSKPDLAAAEKALKELQAQGARQKAWVHYAVGLFEFKNQRLVKARDAFRLSVSANESFYAARTYLGQTEFLLGNFEQARENLKTALAQTPNDPQLNASLGLTELRFKNYARAAELATAALRVDPGNTLALDVLGSAALMLGDASEAIKRYSEYVAKSPDAWDAQLKLGVSGVSSGENKLGLEALAKAANLASNRTPVMVAVAQAYMRSKRFDDAIGVAKKLQSTQPDQSIGLILEGGVYLAQRDLDRANELFKQALAQFPGDPSATMSSVAIAGTKKDYKEVRRLLEEGLAKNPNHIAMRLRLADLDLAENRIEDALTAAESLRNAHPENPSVRFMLAKVHAARGELDELQELLKRPAEQHPGSAEAGLYGESLLATGKAEQAIPVLEKLVTEYPANADARYLLGRAYFGVKELAKAKELALQVVALMPRKKSTAVGNLALLIDLGEFVVAQKFLDELWKLGADDKELWLMDSQLGLAQNDYPRAIQRLGSAARRYPEERAIAMQLARAQAKSGDTAAALKTLDGWLANKAEDLPVLGLKAELVLKSGDRAGALALYHQINDKQAGDPFVLNNIAWLSKDSDRVSALKFAEEAAKIAPNSAAILDTLGMLLMEGPSTETQRAVDAFRKANEIEPETPDIQVNLGEALFKLGNHEEARIILESITKKAPDSSAGLRAKAVLSRY